MNVDPLARDEAAEYASWFKVLADARRVQIVSLLAGAARPMPVGEIVDAVDVGQSTVSAHLRVLAEVGFVHVEHRGTASWYRINDRYSQLARTALTGRPITDWARAGGPRTM